MRTIVRTLVLFVCAVIIGCGEAKNGDESTKEASAPKAAVKRVVSPIGRARVAKDSVGRHQSRSQKEYESASGGK